MNPTQQLLEDLESIKNILMARATGEGASDSEYHRLRCRLTTHVLVKDKLPRFVRTCRSLGEFWSFIREQHRTYAGRRRYIGEQFDEALTFLEQQEATPGDQSINQMLIKVDAPHVAAAWQKALDRRASDPSGAITSARTLIETVCKYILDEQKVSYSETDDLPKLYRLTADSLNLSPSQHTEQLFRQILGGCHAVIEGLGAMRNRHSDAHGTGSSGVRPAARHAELAVNLAGTMATFLLATWESKHK
ncbi:MAG: abortive infection family protein [Pirellulaceae bacterium]